MKPEDLMLGDYVTFKDSLTEGNSPLKVKIIALGYQDRGKEDEVLVQIGDDDTCDIITIDNEIVGIPITPEILEKNGFERFGTDYILRGARFGLDNPSTPNHYVDDYWLRISIRPVHIRFVHELQHALRLCGINKEISL